MPKVVHAEEIGQAGQEIVRAFFPVKPGLKVRWIPRELTGRDLGIDLAAEVIEGGETTGKLIFFQIKGTNEDIVPDEKGYVHFRHTVKNLLYAQQLTIPLILMLVHVPSRDAYWIWLQHYIRVYLAADDPEWKISRTKRIRIPQENVLPSSISTLTHIAGYAKENEEYKELLSQLILVRRAIREIEATLRKTPHSTSRALEGDAASRAKLEAKARDQLIRKGSIDPSLRDRLFHGDLLLDQSVAALIRGMGPKESELETVILGLLNILNFVSTLSILQDLRSRSVITSAIRTTRVLAKTHGAGTGQRGYLKSLVTSVQVLENLVALKTNVGYQRLTEELVRGDFPIC